MTMDARPEYAAVRENKARRATSVWTALQSPLREARSALRERRRDLPITLQSRFCGLASGGLCGLIFRDFNHFQQGACDDLVALLQITELLGHAFSERHARVCFADRQFEDAGG